MVRTDTLVAVHDDYICEVSTETGSDLVGYFAGRSLLHDGIRSLQKPPIGSMSSGE